MPPPHEVDLGELTACCGGRVLFGPHWGVLATSNCLIVVPGLLCVVYTAFSPALAAIVAVLVVVSLVSLWITATMDPGVIPRQPPPTPLPPGMPADRSRTERITIRLRRGGTRDITVDRKWCYTCNLLRPPRAAHCPFCNVCVARRDHHCAFTSTDIGERNYRFFFLFVNTTTILALTVMIGSIAGLVHRQRRQPNAGSVQAFWDGAKETNYLEFVQVLYALVILLMVGGLTIYHWTLVLRNFTTHEETRLANSFDADPHSPFDQGWVGNIVEALFSPIPPSLIKDLPAAAQRSGATSASDSVVGERPSGGSPVDHAASGREESEAPVGDHVRLVGENHHNHDAQHHSIRVVDVDADLHGVPPSLLLQPSSSSRSQLAVST